MGFARKVTFDAGYRKLTDTDAIAAVLYSYGADGDTADLTLDANKRAVSRTISLPGGVLWTATLDVQGNATGRFDVPHGFEVLVIQGAAPPGSAPCVLPRNEEFPQHPQ
ncbi:hypothetical protein [Saccharopolyspora shandongensis]|uniref:hypothetical protein n=1 Tax=Saccharopolyspora shandongensis TaxID=418495 RepID=UPI0033F28351